MQAHSFSCTQSGVENIDANLEAVGSSSWERLHWKRPQLRVSGLGDGAERTNCSTGAHLVRPEILIRRSSSQLEA